MNDEPLGLSRQARKQKPTNDMAAMIVMAVAAVLVLFLAGAWWVVSHTEHPTAAGRSVEVRVPQGASTEQIATMLSRYGVINNGLMFQIEAKLYKWTLRPGSYQLKTGMSDTAAAGTLSKGPTVVYYDVLIPEGFTAAQVARRFAARAHVSEDAMMSLVTSGAPDFVADHPNLKDAPNGSLEGYLFPATYRVKQGTAPRAIIEMMLSKFDEATADLDLSYAKSKNLTLNDVVAIASILEREAKLSKDYPKVASVIYNRLHTRMRLQLDSTIWYIVPAGTTKLTNDSLFIQSPYNTYRNYGLPPGPICNPGLEAMDAAAHPAKTNYLYYVLGNKDGSQTFTVTYADFLVAVKKYHQLFK